MPLIGHKTNKFTTVINALKQNAPSGVTYVGVDPGASGGVAFISPLSSASKPLVDAFSMPDTEADLWELIRTHCSAVQFGVVEQLTGFVAFKKPGGGTLSIPSYTMFKMGSNYGMARMALTAARIPYELATAQKWQKALGVPGKDKKESRTEWKNRLKAFAQRLFPGVNITLATSDAILIAEYARRLKEGNL